MIADPIFASFLPPSRRQTKVKSRRSSSFHGSRRKEQDDGYWQRDFDGRKYAEDPFFKSGVDGKYFDHREESPVKNHRDSRRQDELENHRDSRSQNEQHRKVDRDYEARDDRSLDNEYIEVRRRVEHKMKYARQQVALNEMMAESSGFDFPLDGCEDIYL